MSGKLWWKSIADATLKVKDHQHGISHVLRAVGVAMASAFCRVGVLAYIQGNRVRPACEALLARSHLLLSHPPLSHERSARFRFAIFWFCDDR